MILRKNTAEGGTNGTSLTTANSGGNSGDAFSQVIGAVTFATAAADHGSLGYHFAPVSGSACRIRWSGFNDTTGVFRGYRVSDPAMSVSDGIMAVGTVSATILALQATTGGKYYLTDAAGTTLGTSTNSRAAGDRIELSWTVGTATSNGAWDFYFYRGDATTAVEHLSGTTANLGTTNWDRIDVGKSSTSTQTASFDWDDLLAASGTTALFGPPAAPPSAAFTATPSGLNASFDASASTYNSPATGLISYAWTFGDTSTGSGVTTSHTYASGGTFSVQLTVTDSQGNTGFVSHTVVTTGPNQLPAANAGADQTNISPAATVILDGSGSSDPDGTIAGYAWTQTAGTAVTLSDSSAQKPTFNAPVTSNSQTLSFSLVVTDNSGGSSIADTVNIGVLAATAATIVKSNICEGGTNTASVTTGNSGGTSGTAWNVVAATGGTLVYDSSSAMHGSLGLKFSPASGQQCMVRWSGFNDVTGVAQRYVTIDTLPASGNEAIMSINTATGGGVIGIAISSAGKYQVLDSTASNISGSTLNSYQPGDRIELSWSVATATTGTYYFGLYRGTTSTAIETKSGTSANLGTTGWDRVMFGKTSVSTWTGVQHGDDFAAASGAQTFFGPSGVNIAPTANAGSDQVAIEPYNTVILDGSGSSDPDGTIAGYAWTQTAGSSVSLSNSSAQKPTFVAPATINGATLTFSLIVTDNGGTSSTADTVNVTVLPHTMWRLDSSGPTPLQLIRL